MEPIYTTKSSAQRVLDEQHLNATHKVRHGGKGVFYIDEMSRGERAIWQAEVDRRRARGVNVDDHGHVRMP